VERVAGEGTLDPRQIRVPGILVDCVVVARPEHHMQTYGTHYNAAYSGEVRIPLQTLPPLPLDERKVIARRAALELAPNSIINVGIGIPDCVARIAGEEKIQDLITLTVDPGVIGGVPMSGLDFGAAANYRALIDHCAAFDFVDGGGLDTAFLGFGECDGRGNVNASRFGARAPGCGGFINISQNTRKVVFMGPFTSGGLKIAIAAGRIAIEQEGKHRKFVAAVSQVTVQRQAGDGPRSGSRLRDRALRVPAGRRGAARCRDRAGDRCRARHPAPVAVRAARRQPGIDGFVDLHARADALAKPDAGHSHRRSSLVRRRVQHRVHELRRDARSREDDIRVILDAVDRLLAPLGKRVNSIVNYDRFVVDDDATDAYMDAVRYVEEKYYLKVTRYTNSGFMRMKLGKELENRKLSSRVFESAAEAKRNLESRS
jgi:propionate CoA-transferase